MYNPIGSEGTLELPNSGCRHLHFKENEAYDFENIFGS